MVGNYIYNWPVSQWAAVAKLHFGSQGFFQAGVYDSNTDYPTRSPTPPFGQPCPTTPKASLFPPKSPGRQNSRSRGELPVWRLVE